MIVGIVGSYTIQHVVDYQVSHLLAPLHLTSNKMEWWFPLMCSERLTCSMLTLIVKTSRRVNSMFQWNDVQTSSQTYPSDSMNHVATNQHGHKVFRFCFLNNLKLLAATWGMEVPKSKWRICCCDIICSGPPLLWMRVSGWSVISIANVPRRSGTPSLRCWMINLWTFGTWDVGERPWWMR